MDTIIKDEQDSGVEKSGEKASDSAPTGEEAQGGIKLAAPEHGFDETGEYFIVKIHVKYGYLAILGFLEKAKDFLKMHVAQQMIETKRKQESSLIKPGSTKGFGRFNPFKR